MAHKDTCKDLGTTVPLTIALGRTGQPWEATLLAEPGAEVTSAHSLIDLLVAAEVGGPQVIVVAEDFPRLTEGLAQLRRLGRVVVVGQSPWADCRPDQVSGAELLSRLGPARPARSRLVAVWGPHGSWGVTSVAIGLARGLATKAPTVLIDANVHAPDVADVLSLPAGGLLQACLAADRGAPEVLTATSAGLEVLTGGEPQQYPSVHAGALQQVYAAAGAAFPWVVADTDSAVDAAGEFGLVPDWTTATAVTLHAADHLVVVIGESELAERRLWRALPAVAELVRGRTTVVVNRCRRPRAITARLAGRLGDYVPEAAVGWISDRITPRSMAPIVAEVARQVPAGAG